MPEYLFHNSHQIIDKEIVRSKWATTIKVCHFVYNLGTKCEKVQVLVDNVVKCELKEEKAQKVGTEGNCKNMFWY